jgi:hypothetical protein
MDKILREKLITILCNICGNCTEPYYYGTHCDKSIKQVNAIISALDAYIPEWQRCPICEGKGFVDGAFYISVPGCSGMSTSVTQTCRTCNGSGMIIRPINKQGEVKR